MLQIRLPLAVAGLALVLASQVSAAGVTGDWAGTYSLGGPGELSLSVAGRRAFVTLGTGQAGIQAVAVSIAGDRVRFELPGRPTPLVFEGVVDEDKLVGTARQGDARGTFRAHRGAAPALVAPGLYRTGARTLAAVDDPYGPERIVDLDSGAVHALYAEGPGFRIGTGFATRGPAPGTARFDAAGAHINGTSWRRVRTRQFEVRFRSGGALLSGTLTLPPGAGPHAAVAWVHGSGPTTRAYLPELEALFVRNGVAVLVYDKRGIGQSGGVYPGESPTSETIDVLARDAAAAARFLAAQPEIDRRRVGLAGHSQAGWIAPLAAVREPAIRFLVVYSGPAVTADENDLFQTLAGEGEHPATLTDAEIDAQVLAAGRSGVDPVPLLRKLRIPSLWLYGGRDTIVPPRLSVQRLEGISGRAIEIAVFPNANHALVETTTGLTAEMLRSDTFAPGLFARVGAWLRAHGLTRG